jgi:hypothetical protein
VPSYVSVHNSGVGIPATEAQKSEAAMNDIDEGLTFWRGLAIAVVLLILAAILEWIGVREPLPALLAIGLWALWAWQMVRIHSKEVEEHKEKELARQRYLDQERNARMEEIKRNERLLELLRTADTFDKAKSIHDSASDDELRRLAWHKMQKLI